MQGCNKAKHKQALPSPEFWEENTVAQMWWLWLNEFSPPCFDFRNRSLLAHQGRQKRIFGCQVKERPQSPSFLSQQNLITTWRTEAWWKRRGKLPEPLECLYKLIFHSALGSSAAAAGPLSQERKKQKVTTAAVTAVTTSQGDMENAKWDE